MAEQCDACPPTAAADAAGSGSTSKPVEKDSTDASTFVCPLAPSESSPSFPVPCIVIEYCDRCRWQHRATWVQTELFQTFAPPKAGEAASKASGGASLASIMLVPCHADETAGRFRVWLLHRPHGAAAAPTETALLWDRKSKGAFPELKELKQLIRDHIAPERSLGHSDKGGKHGSTS